MKKNISENSEFFLDLSNIGSLLFVFTFAIT